jgi:hypothetical protein
MSEDDSIEGIVRAMRAAWQREYRKRNGEHVRALARSRYAAKVQRPIRQGNYRKKETTT